MKMIKTCEKCGKIKLSSDFTKSSENSDGLQSWCIECTKHGNRAVYNSVNNISANPPMCLKQAKQTKRNTTKQSQNQTTQINDKSIHAQGKLLSLNDQQQQFLSDIHSRFLLLELKKRGYHWDNMYLTQKVVV